MLPKQIPTKAQIIERYPRLHERFKSSLTDYYNHFLGLQQIAYGTDSQRENSLELVEEDLARDKDAFCYPESLEDIAQRVESPLIDFSELDRVHIQELIILIDHANELAKSRRLARGDSQEIYSILIPFLYGKLDYRETKS